MTEFLFWLSYPFKLTRQAVHHKRFKASGYKCLRQNWKGHFPHHLSSTIKAPPYSVCHFLNLPESVSSKDKKVCVTIKKEKKRYRECPGGGGGM